MTVRSNKVWLFNCANSFSGNPKWLFLYIVKHRPDIEAWWICDSQETTNFIRSLGFNATVFGSAQSVPIQKRAGVFVVNQVKEHIAVNLRGATLLNLWHGVGVKNIERGMTKGYLQERIAKKYILNNRAYHENQLFLVTSPMMEKHFATQIGLAEKNIVRGGYPQNLYAKNFKPFASFDHDIRARKSLASDTKIAIYSPTPRRENGEEFLNAALPDLPRLIATLEEHNTLLILKMHPHMESDPTFKRLKERFENNPYLLFWDNSEDIYEIFHEIDLAIVDYSSILYDLLEAGVKNVIRYIFDYENGNNSLLQEGFDYLELSCGSVTESFDSLLEALGEENRVDEDQRQKLLNTFWDYSEPGSFEHLINAASSFKPEVAELPTLYSFDIFDTLIHRKGVLPVSIFFAIKEQMEASDCSFPIQLIKRFPEARAQAEAASRENRRKRPELLQSGELEIQLSDIYRELATVYSLSDDQVQRLMQWEIDAEIRDTIPNETIIAEALELHTSGETVVLISDMYLPEDVIKRMLQKVSPELARLPIYLSSSVGVQKSTRKLFVHVYEDLDYDFDTWIHTGDNPGADGKAPRFLGIQTRALVTPALDPYETALVESLASYDAYLIAAMLRNDRVAQARSEKENFAFRNVAFYLVPYVHWVVENAIKHNYETLYFVSRDGFHMKRIADAVIETLGLQLKTKYIYGSRASWRFAAQVDFVEDDVFSAYGSFAGVRNLANIAEVSRLTESKLLDLVPALLPWSEGNVITQKQIRTVLNALKRSQKFKEHLLAIGAEDRSLVSKYLSAEINFEEKFALVEYWGRGYTQDCLVRIVGEMQGPLDVPFYYARSIYPTDGHSIRHKYTNANHSMLFIEAIFANLEHGTVTAFEELDGLVRPKFELRDHDLELHLALETQLVKFAHEFASQEFNDADDIGREIFRFGFQHFQANPNHEFYTKNLAVLKDSVELGGQEREFAPELTLSHIVQSVNGVKLTSHTRSLPISLARSSSLVTFLYRFNKKFKFKASVRKLVRTGKRNLKKAIKYVR